MSQSDRIEKEVVLRAPRSRVWQAVADSRQFGEWFRAVFEEPFRAGRSVTATLTEPGWEGTTFVVHVERIEPERHLSFRWHPYPAGPGEEYAERPTTLVSFDLEDVPEGTRLRIVESGFDALPADRGSAARAENEGGWEAQAERIAAYVAKAA